MRISVWILIAVWLLPCWASARDQAIGVPGWVNRIDYIGASAFTADELREGLTADLEFLASAQPHTPRDEFLATLAGRVREGYRHHGFPDATVAAEVSQNGQRTIVRVSEGARYRCGHVLVRGGRTINHAVIEQAFTDPWAATQLKSVATLKADGLQTRWEAPTGRKATLDPPLWVPGTPLKAADFDLARFHARAREALELEGFHFAKFHTFLQRAPQAQSATLVIEIDEQGPPIVFAGLLISGETRDSVRDVARFLDVKWGQRLDPRATMELGRRLWQSGRYFEVNWKIEPIGLEETPSPGDSQHSKEAPDTAEKTDWNLSSSKIFSGSSLRPGKSIPENGAASRDTSTPPEKQAASSAHPVPLGPDPNTPVSAHVHLELTDVVSLPRLSEELTPADRAMLKLCEWLRHWPDDSQYDLVASGKVHSWEPVERELFRFGDLGWSVSLPSPDSHWRFRTVFSPGGNVFVRVRLALDQEEPDFDQAAIIRSDGIDWRFPLRGSRLTLPWPDQRRLDPALWLPIISRDQPIGDTGTGRLYYRVSRGKFESSAKPAKPGVYPGFLVDPPLVLLYLRSEGVTHSIADGVLRVSSPRLKLEVDAASGRLIHAHTIAWNGTTTIDFWTERGALATAARELDEETGPLTDRMDPEDPWGSVCECLRWEFSPLGNLAAIPAWPKTAAALRVVRQLDPRLLVEVLQLLEKAPRPFAIPSADEPIPGSYFEPPRGGDVAAVLLRHLPNNDHLRALVVDALLQRARGDTFFAHEIPAILRGRSSGPLTRLLAVTLLPDNQSELRGLAAARAAEQLTSADVLEELRTLIFTGTPVGAELEQFIDALGQLSEEECRALAWQLLPGDLAQAVLKATAPLRRERLRPVRELFPEMFDRFWSGGFERELVHCLENWARPVVHHPPSESTDALDTAFPVVPAGFIQSDSAGDVDFPDEIPEFPVDESPIPEPITEPPPE